MVHPSQKQPPYPRREPQLSVTFSLRGRTRGLAIRPWIAISALGLVAALATSVIGAAAYLLYHDDLLAASVSRQVEMQYAYEERISALRSELDRITSRHVVQTEGVEQQLVTLLNRQALIEERQSSLDALLEKARESGVEAADAAARLPRARPAAEPEREEPQGAPIGPLGYMPAAEQEMLRALLHGGEPGGSNPLLRSTFARVQSSLDDAQGRQEQALHALGASVEEESERLSTALMPIGIAVEERPADDAGPQGGPFLPVAGLHFIERTTMVGRMLDDILLLRRSAAAMPLKAPLPSLRITSRYGYRLDPFLKRSAFHAGLDLAAAAGTTVRATAPGIVAETGWNDGYGIMVEIRHADGVSTRYGHLSATLVSPGDEVVGGTPIALVGTTGRSTGPHLHYETRRNGEAVNPAVFFAAGRALGGS
jgi:murein DD-endopeptidase MepM/ murein hydrolase activator NlpD